MRDSYWLACAMAVLAAAAGVACATSENDVELSLAPDSGGSEAAIPDGGSVEDTDADADVDVDGLLCSKAGWCATSLPDADLSMRDIWPLPGRAFAIAESQTLGVKVLEWDDAEAKWKYIDDSTQVEPGMGHYAGGIWAPNESEVYYAVAPGYIYHGNRSATPGAPWSWTRHRLEDNSHPGGAIDPEDGYPLYSQIGIRRPALGVWGTSSGDVYAWFTNTIYRWKSVDGGAPGWVSEHVADDSENPDEHLFFVAAGGTGPDDVWFSGARSRKWAACALAVRKTPAGYQRVADGILPSTFQPCTPRAGTLMIGGSEGWLTDIQALAADQLVGLKGGGNVVRISVAGDSYSVALSTVPPALSKSKPWDSLSAVQGTPWLSGWGLVIRGTDVWDDGGYAISTTSMRGPPGRRVYRVRGASNTHLWAIGDGYALHKTTP
ncbi:MAG: hypothetical protein J0I07_19995 [Myxococcales bacterium]|nr:hypothetical protein [Myxococcales bacterium]